MHENSPVAVKKKASAASIPRKIPLPRMPRNLLIIQKGGNVGKNGIFYSMCLIIENLVYEYCLRKICVEIARIFIGDKNILEFLIGAD